MSVIKDTVYVATSDDLHFVTDGKTFEELLSNIQECLQLCLVDGDSITEYDVKPSAQVKLTMDLPKLPLNAIVG